jgi:hypothetical protein
MCFLCVLNKQTYVIYVVNLFIAINKLPDDFKTLGVIS